MFAAAGLLGGCVSTPLIVPPTLELAGLRIDKLSVRDPNLGLILRVRNPNRIGLPLRQLEVVVELNERSFAEGQNTEATTLPAQGSALVELTVHARSEVLWTTLKEMVHSPGGSVRYRIHGTAIVSSLDLHFPFDTRGTTDFDTLMGRNRRSTPPR